MTYLSHAFFSPQIESDKYQKHLEEAQNEHVRLLESTIAALSQQNAALQAANTSPVACLERWAEDIKETAVELYIPAISKWFKEFVAPKQEDATNDYHHMKGWQILYLFVFCFNILIYLSYVGTYPTRWWDLYPVQIWSNY